MYRQTHVVTGTSEYKSAFAKRRNIAPVGTRAMNRERNLHSGNGHIGTPGSLDPHGHFLTQAQSRRARHARKYASSASVVFRTVLLPRPLI